MNAFRAPVLDFGPTSLVPELGNIPPGLRGLLCANGAARFTRNGETVGHWFDGDAAVFSCTFDAHGAHATYRAVQSKETREEERSGRFLYPGLGRSGPLLSRLAGRLKLPPNVNVMAFDDRLIALSEGSTAYSLCIDSLATLGEERFGSDQPVSPCAHYRTDPTTGEIYGFGLSRGLRSEIRLYRFTRNGRISHETSYDVQRPFMCHDFVLTARFLVFFLAPIALEASAIAAYLVGTHTIGELFSWKPSLGTEILIFDRATLELRARSKSKAWAQWHFANGFENNAGEIVVDFVKYRADESFVTSRWLDHLHKGEVSDLRASEMVEGAFTRMVVDPESAKVLYEEAYPCASGVEFPVTFQNDQLKPTTDVYMLKIDDSDTTDDEFFNTILHLDASSGEVRTYRAGDGCYLSEVKLCPSSDPKKRGWALSIVYDGNQDRSSLYIFDAECVDAGPVCILPLPGVVPPTFHGTFRSL